MRPSDPKAPLGPLCTHNTFPDDRTKKFQFFFLQLLVTLVVRFDGSLPNSSPFTGQKFVKLALEFLQFYAASSSTTILTFPPVLINSVSVLN